MSDLIEREYQGRCGYGHRSYLRLRSWDELTRAACPTCAREHKTGPLTTAELTRLEPKWAS